MKIVIELMDGDRFTDTSYEGIVKQLKLEDWTNYQSPTDYKDNIARRVRIFNGHRLKYSNDKEFLEELYRIGFIKNIVGIY